VNKDLAPGGAAFTLFVAGDSPNSRAASATLRRALAQLGEGPDAIRIIDVFEDPQAASEARVLVTPTLLRGSDARVRILGDLSNPGQLLDFLRTP
jgi:circadian clock protein KaiB